MLILAWWLVSISNGPEGFDSFHAVMDSPLGLLVLFGITWSLAFHFCSGVRHLAWDLGYGFSKKDSRLGSIWVIALSVVGAVAIFACVWTGHGGYLR
jgi:succinate dehydrogenase / fumarate reductase cytochrome b subunit